MSASGSISTPAQSPPGLRWLVVFAVVTGATALGLLFQLNPEKHGFFPKCVFHSISGLECPGCGGQRALHHLLHGDFAVAVRCNALLIALLPVAMWYLLRWAARRAGGFVLPSPFRHHAWPWVLAVVVVLFGIVRNLPGFDWLRP